MKKNNIPNDFDKDDVMNYRTIIMSSIRRLKEALISEYNTEEIKYINILIQEEERELNDLCNKYPEHLL